MKESGLTHLVAPLREMVCQFDMIIPGYRERSGARVAGTVCDILPAEIPASLGLVPVRVPLAGGCCAAAGVPDMGDIGRVYDCVVVPRGCAGREGLRGLHAPLFEFATPPGWGEIAAREMASALNDLLRDAGCGGTASLDRARLREVTAEYNALRRLVRGIGSVRSDNPRLLSCRDLAAVHEAAAVFPPAVVAGPLSLLLDAMNAAESAGPLPSLPVLVYAGFTGGADVLDELEEEGCRIVEDDACGGRRQFDMSYNHESDDLFGEILDAFSYRPRCPSVRTVEERVELFYAMMKGQGIELVVFIEDLCCPARLRDIGPLRKRLMRSGVDPLVVTTKNAAEKIREYSGRM